MSQTKRSIFRDSATRRYLQRRNKDVLPRFVAPPVFLFCWILLGLLLVAGFLIWSARIPVTISVPGVIVPGAQSGQGQVLLFASASQRAVIQPGQLVQIQIGATEPHLQMKLSSVDFRVLNPDQIRERYHLEGTLGLVVTQPSIVAVVALTNGAASQGLTGSLVSAQVQIGTRSALSLFLFPGQ